MRNSGTVWPTRALLPAFAEHAPNAGTKVGLIGPVWKRDPKDEHGGEHRAGQDCFQPPFRHYYENSNTVGCTLITGDEARCRTRLLMKDYSSLSKEHV